MASLGEEIMIHTHTQIMVVKTRRKIAEVAGEEEKEEERQALLR